MSLWTMCILAGAVLQIAVSRCVGRGFWRKLLVPALILLGAVSASSEDFAFTCLCMLVGTVAGACIHWISLSFEA